MRIASVEIAEGVAHADTLECHVLQTEGDLCSIGIWPSSGDDWWLLRVDRRRLDETRSVEASLESLHRIGVDGAAAEEDLAELRKSQLFRRRLEDPFEDPMVEERELDDATLAGRQIRRREVELTERNERRIPLGHGQAMLYSIELNSVAQLSPDLPVFGLLRSHMISTERTERVDEAGGRIGPPPEVQNTERSLECLDFGHDSKRRIPDSVN